MENRRHVRRAALSVEGECGWLPESAQASRGLKTSASGLKVNSTSQGDDWPHSLTVEEARAIDLEIAESLKGKLCSDCPPERYRMAKTRCLTCPRRAFNGTGDV